MLLPSLTRGTPTPLLGRLSRPYTMASKPSTTTAMTASGKILPPWKRTFLPLPREASLATFLADDDDATKMRGYRLAASKQGHRPVRRPPFNSTIRSAYIRAIAEGDAAAS